MAGKNGTGVLLPRVIKKGQQSNSTSSGKDRGQALSERRSTLLSQSVSTLRSQGKVVEAIRVLREEHGTLSTTLFTLVEVADSGYSISAYNTLTNQPDEPGRQVALQVIASMDTLYDYTDGYSDKPTIAEVVMQSLLEAAVSGRVAGELILDKYFLPTRLKVMRGDMVKWKADGKGNRYPVQKANGAGDDVDLDYPTVWVHDLQGMADDDNATPPLQAALNALYRYEDFIEDMVRVVRRTGHGRIVVKLIYEKIKETADPETQADEEKLAVYLNDVKKAVEEGLKNIEPEDALVTYDTAEFDSISANGEKADYTELLSAIQGILVTSLKSNPSATGIRMGGSQSLSNTESLIYLKNAAALHAPVEAMLSRALTLACRLMGADVYVKFEFNPINLRPADELEAFVTMKESRILNRLSLGLIDDNTAARELGITALPKGYVPLAGTMFMNGSTGRAEEVSPNADPQGRALQPTTPKKGGGKSQ